MQRFVNNWAAELLAPATSTDLELTIDAGLAAQLVGLADGDYYLLTLVERVEGEPETAWEIVRVTAQAAGVLTVQRGQDGTAPAAWSTGAVIEARLTAGAMNALSAGTSFSGSYADLTDKPFIPETPGDIGAATAPQGERADTAVQPSVLAAALDEKVDKVVGQGLSDENFTIEEKEKLAGLDGNHWRGTFISFVALQAAVPIANPGDYARVDAGPAEPVSQYIWDESDGEWIAGGGDAPAITAAQVKILYESNPDTNPFSNAEKAKLAGVAAGATANADTDSLAEGSTNLYHTAARVRAVVLAGLSLATGAAVTAGDSLLAAIGKLQKQITDLSTTVGGKQDALSSGVNIKTINGQSIVGSGNLSVTATVAQVIPIACSDETTALTAGSAKVTFRMPYAFTLSAVRASLTTPQASGSILTVDINENGVSILSTKLTIDNTEKTSATAATAAVISDTTLADDAEITIDLDQVGDGTAKGLKIYLIGTP